MRLSLFAPEQAPAGVQFMVTLENAGVLPTPNRLLVVTENPDFGNLAEGRIPANEILHKVVPESCLESFSQHPAVGLGSTAVRMESLTPRDFLDRQLSIRQLDAEYLADPGQQSALIGIMALSLGIPVRLNPLPGWSNEVLEEYCEYFFRSPSLQVRLEPLYFLSMRVAGRGQGTWWDFYGEILGRSFYMDTAGRLTLSERWALAGRYFGDISCSLESLRNSELWRELESFPVRCFTDDTPCRFCSHFEICGGFFYALRGRSEDCSGWLAVFDKATALYESLKPSPAGG